MNPEEHGDCAWGRVEIPPGSSTVTLIPADRTFRVIPLDVKTPGKIWSRHPDFENLEFKPTCGPDGQTPGCNVYKDGHLDFSGTVECLAVCGERCVAVLKIESRCYSRADGTYAFSRDGELQDVDDGKQLSEIITDQERYGLSHGPQYNGIGGPRLMFVGKCYCTGSSRCVHQSYDATASGNGKVFMVESCTTGRATFQQRMRLPGSTAEDWCERGYRYGAASSESFENECSNGIATHIMCVDPDKLDRNAARISASPSTSPTSSPTANPTDNPSQAPTKFPTTASPVTKSPVTKSPTLPVVTSRPISTNAKRKMIRMCLQCTVDAPESDSGSCASKEQAVMRSFCEQNNALIFNQNCAKQLGIEGIDYLLDSWCDNGVQRRLRDTGSGKNYMFRILFGSDAATLPLDGDQCAGIMADLGTKVNRCGEGTVDKEGKFMPLEPVKPDVPPDGHNSPNDVSIFGSGMAADIGIFVILIGTLIAMLGAVLWCAQTKKKEKEAASKRKEHEIEMKALKVDEEIDQTDGGMP